jgi:hypothetical protein
MDWPYAHCYVCQRPGRFLPQLGGALGGASFSSKQTESAPSRLGRRKAWAMRRRSPLMRAAATGAALALALPLAVRAEGPADRASRTLNFEVRRDRAWDEALSARVADKARSTPAPAASPRRLPDRRGPRRRRSGCRPAGGVRPIAPVAARDGLRFQHNPLRHPARSGTTPATRFRNCLLHDFQNGLRAADGRGQRSGPGRHDGPDAGPARGRRSAVRQPPPWVCVGATGRRVARSARSSRFTFH